MDEYWRKYGEELARRKQEAAVARTKQKQQPESLQKPVNKQSKFESTISTTNHANKFWPKSISNVYNILKNSKIKFKKGKLVGSKRVDFAIQKLKLFIDITDSECQTPMNSFYKDWRLVRITSVTATNFDECYVALKPIINEWLQSS